MSNDSASWTINHLARLAAAALAAGAPAQPNGRIREVPDVRTIRWYTSIGLLGRPAAMRGRTALYGRSHLAQLVAIKRLQAGGLSVAAVQERLLGADEAVIEGIAELPDDLDALVAGVEGDAEAPADNAKPQLPRTRFWVAAADRSHAADEPAASAVRAKSSARSASPTEAASLAEAAPTTEASPATDTAPLVQGIRLAPDITLLLPPGRVPDAADRTAIAEAARPLLDLLDRLGLSES